MSTPSPSPPPSGPDFTPTGPPTADSTTSSNNLAPGNSPPTSLYLYTFVATLSLLFVIFSMLVARSVRLRRQRHAAVLAAIATGSYSPSNTALHGRRAGNLLAPKPVLWEARIVPSLESTNINTEKGWDEILPLAGATMVLVTKSPESGVRFERAPQRSQLRIPAFATRPSVVPDPSTVPPLEASIAFPAPAPSKPIHLSVLVSMPTPPVPWMDQRENGGPPVVELGVTKAEYAPGL
ncbi:hypothetical protein BC827DRAFT_1269726 [Russula dissimulans]|nr:hypothetical protein BC827DRAFT_1269726 [Russula dissimulans]